MKKVNSVEKYIETAKREVTKANRLEKITPMILDEPICCIIMWSVVE